MSKRRTRSVTSEETLFAEETARSQCSRTQRRARPSYLAVKNYELEELTELSGSERDSDGEESSNGIKNAFKKKPRGSFIELTA